MGYSYCRQVSFGGFSNSVFYIIVVNVVVFVFKIFFPELTSDWLSLIPLSVFPGFQLWRIFSYLFVHSDFSHILFNLIGLYFFGPPLENYLGSRRFWIYYFLCGAGSGVVSVFFYEFFDAGYVRIVGASGALFGILMGYGLLYPNSRVYLNFVFPVKAKWMVLIYGVLEFLAILSYMGGMRSRVASIAHLSGLLIGYLYLRGARDLKRFRSWYLGHKMKEVQRKRQKFKVFDGEKEPPFKAPTLH